MKVNLLWGNGDGISGYVNIDPHSYDKENITNGDVTNLDDIIDNSEATEILAADIIDYLPHEVGIKTIGHWVTKLRHKGKLTVGGSDIYEISKECGEKTFITDKGEISGQSFIGKKVYGSGIFMFLNPQAGDTFEANNCANERYLRFCETLKKDCPEIEVDIDGEKRMVKQFPELSNTEMIGKPIMGFIDIEEYTDKDGKEKMSYKVKDFTEWADGKEKEAELPF